MIHIKILWYISEISDTYQKFSDTYQLFLIHIRNFWYISKFYDTYQNFMIHIRNFWYISEISDTYQIFLIHIRNFWYVDTYQKFLIHMFLDVKTWLVSEFLIHTSLGDTICVKKFQIEWFWKLFSNFFTHIVHIHHVCTSCFFQYELDYKATCLPLHTCTCTSKQTCLVPKFLLKLVISPNVCVKLKFSNHYWFCIQLCVWLAVFHKRNLLPPFCHTFCVKNFAKL